MVVEDEEKEAMDIIAPRLLPHTGEDAAAALKLRTAVVKPPQLRPSGNDRDVRRGKQQVASEIPQTTETFPDTPRTGTENRPRDRLPRVETANEPTNNTGTTEQRMDLGGNLDADRPTRRHPTKRGTRPGIAPTHRKTNQQLPKKGQDGTR